MESLMMSGIAMALAAAGGYALNNVCLARLRGRASSQIIPATLLWNVVLLGCLSAVPRASSAGLADAPWAALALSAVVGLMSAWLGRWGLFFAIARIGPSRASTIKNCAPLFSLPLGILLFDQVPTPVGLAGVGLIVTAVWLLGSDRRAGRSHSSGSDRSGADSIADARYVAGLLMGLVMALMFGASDSVRLLSLQLWSNPLAAAWTGSVAALLASVLWLGVREGWGTIVTGTLRTASNGWVVLAGVATSAAQVANFAAVTRLDVVYVTALLALAPVLTLVIGKVLSPGSEAVGVRALNGMVVVLVGTVLVVVGR
jgi:drug/metabolite transporter (DMT)-like permease